MKKYSKHEIHQLLEFFSIVKVVEARLGCYLEQFKDGELKLFHFCLISYAVNKWKINVSTCDWNIP